MVYGCVPVGTHLLSFQKYGYSYGINMQQIPVSYHAIYQNKDVWTLFSSESLVVLLWL